MNRRRQLDRGDLYRKLDDLQQAIMRHDPGLAASPPVRDILKVGRSKALLFACPLWTDQPLRSGPPGP